MSAPGGSSGQAPSGPRRWVLNVCPECNSAVVAGSAWVPPEFVRNCRHPVRPDLDQGRNVPRVPITVQAVRSEPSVEQETRALTRLHDGLASAASRWLAANDEIGIGPTEHDSRFADQIERLLNDARAILRAAAAVEGGGGDVPR